MAIWKLEPIEPYVPQWRGSEYVGPLFQLWDVIPEEVAGFFRDIRPYVSLCRFPDCTHTHENDCAVKDAVADGRLDARRYESCCHIQAGDLA